MHIRVNGNPAPQGSVAAFAIKRKGVPTGRVGMKSDNPALADWREAVRAEAQRELERGAGLEPGAHLFGPGEPVIIRMVFYLARPAGHFGTGRNAGLVKAGAPRWPMGGKRGDDWDKLARAVCDGLQAGGVVADDKQFIGTPGTWKTYADGQAPGADIWVDPAPAGIPAQGGAGPFLPAGYHALIQDRRFCADRGCIGYDTPHDPPHEYIPGRTPR